MLENDGIKNFPYSLESCKQVTLKIEYREWEWDDKLELFFNNLFTLNSGTKSLNRTISQLKEHVKNNQTFILQPTKLNFATKTVRHKLAYGSVFVRGST
ncbi:MULTISPECIES: hypothetical protein [Moraxella]|uniref:Uncharacterized protein n=1 Tax=Moraxella lacunata TaxID=477 RepID=A0A1B8PWD6_MORLA|nr:MULTISPECIES: hypothetical protein [Moraxella]MBE9578087.1 hypothetical protein [Moraxella sp. K1664]MBE9587577.1 hypothetical protein [Moraxella sp. K1630]MBE9595775.1 hypothetical protein [Moraxella sp. K2450]MDH9218019.1 hypothetical protein [Moraxella lacunata]MDI4482590.1 hypothetical protein [Moraxella lacunata]